MKILHEQVLSFNDEQGFQNFDQFGSLCRESLI